MLCLYLADGSFVLVPVLLWPDARRYWPCGLTPHPLADLLFPDDGPTSFDPELN